MHKLAGLVPVPLEHRTHESRPKTIVESLEAAPIRELREHEKNIEWFLWHLGTLLSRVSRGSRHNLHMQCGPLLGAL